MKSFPGLKDLEQKIRLEQEGIERTSFVIEFMSDKVVNHPSYSIKQKEKLNQALKLVTDVYHSMFE